MFVNSIMSSLRLFGVIVRWALGYGIPIVKPGPWHLENYK